MNVPSASEMRELLSNRVNVMFKAKGTYLKSQSELLSAGVSLRYNSISLVSCLEDILLGYFNGLCETLTEAHRDGTEARISLDSALYDVNTLDTCDLFGEKTSFRVRLNASEKESVREQKALLKEALDGLNFKKIEAALAAGVKAVYSEGLRKVSDDLCVYLNLFYAPHYERSTQVRGRHVVSVLASSQEFHSSKINDLGKIISGLNYVTKETGVVFGEAVHLLKTELDNARYDEPVPSRTCFGKGNSLEIMCFKEKYEFRFSHEAFDALSAFVSLYGSEEKIEKVLEITRQLEIAA